MTIPFSGETMECVVCGAKDKSDPARSTYWRALQVGGKTYYACPKEFPADGATVVAFRDAYRSLIRAVVAKEARMKV